MQLYTYTRGNFRIKTENSQLDISFIHKFLSEEAYWSKGIPLETVQKSIENSLNFGLFEFEKQIGFARVISDYATIAYLGDVFILDAYRGKGLSKWLMQVIEAHPQLQDLRRWILLTSDAHGLYEKIGFKPIAKPELYMERHDPEVYRKLENVTQKLP